MLSDLLTERKSIGRVPLQLPVPSL